MPFYENVFIARQDLTPAKVKELANKFAAVVKENGGVVAKTEDWGLRDLAYKIQKNRKGYYTMLAIDAPATAVIEMERQMRFDEDVIRYLSVRVDELEEGPSAMMSYKGKDIKSRARKFDDRFDIEDESEEF